MYQKSKLEPTASDLTFAAEAIRGLLTNQALPDKSNMERFGAYLELVNELILASLVDRGTLRRLWDLERYSVPQLATLVEPNRLHPHKGLIGLGESTDTLVWVGSVDDYGVAHSVGVPSCVAVPDIPKIKSNYAKSLGYLADVEDRLMSIQQHILMLPNTADGRALQGELTRRLGPERCCHISWPSDCETVRDVQLSHGDEVVLECIANATPAPIHGVVTVESLRQRMHDWYHHGSPQGVSPGWPSLARHYRVLEGELTLITGSPSTGKSTWSSAMLVNIAQQHGWRFSIFSPEQSPPERYTRMITTQHVGLPFDQGWPNRMSWRQADEALTWLNQHFSFLWPKDRLPSVEHILELARAQVFRSGIRGIVIDPWNRVAHQKPAGMPDTDYIGQSLVKIQAFAQTYSVHAFIVAHPTKLIKEGTAYPVVTPNMIAGSANWWNMPDNILSLWRNIGDSNDDRLDIHTQKIRFDENGDMGKIVQLHYRKDSKRYTE